MQTLYRYKKRFVVAITGASGVVYGLELIRHLLLQEFQVHCIITETARPILSDEISSKNYSFIGGLGDGKFESKNPDFFIYKEDDFHAPCASGSFKFEAMVVSPCSMKTLGKIANSIGDNLVVRASEVALKERRKLVLVPRETPLALTHLRNMVSITEAGGIILPACPGFYHDPKTIEDLVDFITARTLMTIDVEQNFLREWGDE